jgi:uncharacterized membrane protein
MSFLIVITAGLSFIVVGIDSAKTGLILLGTLLPTALLSILFVVAVYVPAAQGVEDESEVRLALARALRSVCGPAD